MNVERLARVRQAILDHAGRFNYAAWIDSPSHLDSDAYDFKSLLNPMCNTVGCIAGWTLALFENESAYDPKTAYACRFGNVSGRAANLLDLDCEGALFLFYACAGHGLGDLNVATADYTAAIERIDILLECSGHTLQNKNKRRSE